MSVFDAGERNPAALRRAALKGVLGEQSPAFRENAPIWRVVRSTNQPRNFPTMKRGISSAILLVRPPEIEFAEGSIERETHLSINSTRQRWNLSWLEPQRFAKSMGGGS